MQAPVLLIEQRSLWARPLLLLFQTTLAVPPPELEVGNQAVASYVETLVQNGTPNHENKI
jgi:hypothetical protein